MTINCIFVYKAFRELLSWWHKKWHQNSSTFSELTLRPVWGLAGLLIALASMFIWWQLCLPRDQSNRAGSTNLPLSNSSLTKRSNFSAKCLLAHQTIAMIMSTMAIVIRPSQKGSSSIRCDSGLYGRCSQRVSHRRPTAEYRTNDDVKHVSSSWNNFLFFALFFILKASFLLPSREKHNEELVEKYLELRKGEKVCKVCACPTSIRTNGTKCSALQRILAKGQEWKWCTWRNLKERS